MSIDQQHMKTVCCWQRAGDDVLIVLSAKACVCVYCAVELVGMLAAAHQEVPEALHRLAQKDSRFRRNVKG